MTERRRTADAPRVIVVDIGVDAALYSEPGNRVLVLRPGQTFNNAVAAAQRCLPDSHPDTIRAIVRTNLPSAPDFDPPETVPTRVGGTEHVEPPTRWYRRWRRSLVPLLAAALAVVVLGTLGVVRALTGSADGPFTDEAFMEFARRGEFVCQQIGELRATCTDPRGGELISEATVGPRSVVYMFSYGERRVGLRVFADGESARKWASNPPTQAMYPNVRSQGRFVLWGNDTEKIDFYLSLLKDPPSLDNPGRDNRGMADSRGMVGALGSPSGEVGAPEVSGEPNASTYPSAVSETAGMFGQMVRAPARDVSAPSSDGLPASLGAVMMATLGVDADEADRASEVGLERVLPPVQVVAVKLTLGMPGSDDADSGDGGPSDDAPIDEPSGDPTPTEEPGGYESTSDDTATPTPTPTPSPSPTSSGSPEPSSTGEPTSTTAPGTSTSPPTEAEPEPSKPEPSAEPSEPEPTATEPSATETDGSGSDGSGSDSSGSDTSGSDASGDGPSSEPTVAPEPSRAPDSRSEPLPSPPPVPEPSGNAGGPASSPAPPATLPTPRESLPELPLPSSTTSPHLPG